MAAIKKVDSERLLRRVNELFAYDRDSGTFLLRQDRGRVLAGSIAGSVHPRCLGHSRPPRKPMQPIRRRQLPSSGSSPTPEAAMDGINWKERALKAERERDELDDALKDYREAVVNSEDTLSSAHALLRKLRRRIKFGMTDSERPILIAEIDAETGGGNAGTDKE